MVCNINVGLVLVLRRHSGGAETDLTRCRICRVRNMVLVQSYTSTIQYNTRPQDQEMGGTAYAMLHLQRQLLCLHLHWHLHAVSAVRGSTIRSNSKSLAIAGSKRSSVVCFGLRAATTAAPTGFNWLHTTRNSSNLSNLSVTFPFSCHLAPVWPQPKKPKCVSVCSDYLVEKGISSHFPVGPARPQANRLAWAAFELVAVPVKPLSRLVGRNRAVVAAAMRASSAGREWRPRLEVSVVALTGSHQIMLR